MDDVGHELLWRAAPLTLAESQAHAMLRGQTHAWHGGALGRVTALLDWCEANYEVTHHVAEFYNTLSNISMIALALLGMWRSWGALPPRIAASYAAILVVGIGSAAFHATLWYWTQLLDEVPMVCANAVFVYTLAPRAVRQSWQLKLVLFLYLAVTVGVYVAIHSVALHETMYGLGVAYLTVRSVQIVRNEKLRDRHPAVARTIFASIFGFLVVRSHNGTSLRCRRCSCSRSLARLPSP